MTTKKKNGAEDHFTRTMKDPVTRAHFEREWFVDEILSALELKMNEGKITRTELARRLKCTPANVTKLLRRGTNLTIGSVVDLALAIEHRFIAPALEPLSGEPPWFAGCSVVLAPAQVWVSASIKGASEAEVPASPSFSWPDYVSEGEAGTLLN